MPWLRLAPCRFQAIEGATRGVVPHDDPGVIVTEKPIGGSHDPFLPLLVADNGRGTGTGISEGRHLNGLLVESRTFVIGTATSYRGDREMAVLGLPGEQPFQELQSVLHEGRTLER